MSGSITISNRLPESISGGYEPVHRYRRVSIFEREGRVVAKGERGEIIRSEQKGAYDTEILQEAIYHIAGPKIMKWLDDPSTQTGKWEKQYGDPGRRVAPAKIVISCDLDITGPVDLTDIIGLEISGLGHKYGATVLNIKTDEDVVIDMTNSRFCRFTNMKFAVWGDHKPGCVHFLAQDKDRYSSGDHKFENCDWHGGVRHSLVYNCCSEGNHFVDCYFNTGDVAITLTEGDVSKKRQKTGLKRFTIHLPPLWKKTSLCLMAILKRPGPGPMILY